MGDGHWPVWRLEAHSLGLRHRPVRNLCIFLTTSAYKRLIVADRIPRYGGKRIMMLGLGAGALAGALEELRSWLRGRFSGIM
jgi:hypothetical protein